jgi:ACR3 family arsenite transporter
VYVAFPLVSGVIVRLILVKIFGKERFEKYFLRFLTPVTIIALFFTLIMIFALNAEIIWENPLIVLMILTPLTIQFFFAFSIGYFLAWLLKIPYEDAAPSAIIGTSSNFEVAIATASVLYGMSSGAALATTVGVITEVPLMLLIVKVCGWTKHWFKGFKSYSVSTPKLWRRRKILHPHPIAPVFQEVVVGK